MSTNMDTNEYMWIYSSVISRVVSEINFELWISLFKKIMFSKTVGTVEHIKLSQTIAITSNKVMDFHFRSFLVLCLSSFGARHNVFVLSVRAPVHHKKCTWNASHIFKREFLKTLHPCVFPYGKSISLMHWTVFMKVLFFLM